MSTVDSAHFVYFVVQARNGLRVLMELRHAQVAGLDRFDRERLARRVARSAYAIDAVRAWQGTDFDAV